MTAGITELLRDVTTRATGCTEPAAIAFAAATASEMVQGEVRHIRIGVDSYTFKNANAVIIPNSGGGSGVQMAAALGAQIRDSSSKLEMFSNLRDGTVEQARRLVSEQRVTLRVLRSKLPIYIDVAVQTARSTARALIKGGHTSLVRLEVDGQAVLKSESASEEAESNAGMSHPLLSMSIPEVIALTRVLHDRDVEYLLAGSELNLALATAGLRHRLGFGIGESLQRWSADKTDLLNAMQQVKASAAAAVEARMAGESMPVMANSGSGNQGLLVTIPISVMSQRSGTRKTDLARALATGHLLAAFSRIRLGTLSTMCASAVAGAIGAAAGIACLTADEEELAGRIREAIRIIVSALSGVLCPGAGPVCALKLYVASGVAVEAAFLSAQGFVVPHGFGLAAPEAESSLNNLGYLAARMSETHRAMLSQLLDHVSIDAGAPAGAG